MGILLALDVAILPPEDVRRRATAWSAALPESESRGLRLGPERLPHLTLTQQFVAADGLPAAVERIAGVLQGAPPLHLRAVGGERAGDTVWIAIERSAAVLRLHEALMDALRDLEQAEGTVAAFVDGDARDRDVAWVSGFRARASFTAFTPHITIGHAAAAPRIDPFEFDARTVAACHLGRFCTCRRVLRAWTLSAPAPATRSTTPNTGSPSA